MGVFFNHEDAPYLGILNVHVDPKVDEQTMMFFYIQALLLPEEEVADEFKCFFVRHPSQYKKKYKTVMGGCRKYGFGKIIRI